MKILYSRFTPIWVFIILYVITLGAALLIFKINLYLGILSLIFVIICDYKFTIKMKKNEKWLKDTMNNDSFIRNNHFYFGSVGPYSISLISKTTLRVIVHKTNVGSYVVNDYFTNFPSKGINIILNGINVFYFDISLSDIKKVSPEGNFGVKIDSKNGDIIQLDTSYAHLLCSEINQNIINVLDENAPVVIETTIGNDIGYVENKNIPNPELQDVISNKKASKKIIKVFLKLMIYGILIPIFSIIFLIVMNELSKEVNWMIATGISTCGIIFFFLSKTLKKRDELFISEKLGVISLSSPLFIDLFSILGIVFIITGLFLNFDIINSVLNAKGSSQRVIIVKIAFGAVGLFLYYRAYRRLRYSMFDIIIITHEEICIDDPKSNDTIKIIKKDINNIIQVINRSTKTNKIESKGIEIYTTKEGIENTYKFDELYLGEMNISYHLFINSLNKLGYIINKDV
jgi:hypothetical protein